MRGGKDGVGGEMRGDKAELGMKDRENSKEHEWEKGSKSISAKKGK